MLAELASNTKALDIEQRLPQDLKMAAHVLSGEPAWSGLDALRVVNWLCDQNCAVVGVELWRDANGAASWVATSNYSPRPSNRITPEEIARCAAEASRFIREFDTCPEDLFNLTWLPPAPQEPPATLAA